MSLITICDDAAGRQGLGQFTSIVANTNGTARRLFKAANASLKALVRKYDWQILQKEHTFVTVAAEIQTNTPLPTDFDHYITETGYNRTRNRALQGPLSPQEWQQMQAFTVNLATDSFRVRANQFLMSPAPTAGDTVAYEYVSNLAVAIEATPTVGVKVAFTLDTDVPLLDEEVLTVDIIWRYRKSAGLGYAEDFRDAQLLIADRIAKDGVGKRRMDLAHGPRLGPPRRPIIQEGNWIL